MMKKIHCFILLFLALPFLAKSQNWQPIGPDDFNQASLGDYRYSTTSTSTGIPYVASVYGGKKILVKKYNGGKWETVIDGVFTSSNSSEVKIAFNGTTPYVLYTDQSNNNRITVKKYNGTNWEVVGVEGISPNYVQQVALILNGDVPYIMYADYTNNNKLVVKKFDGTNWVSLGINVSANYATSSSMAFDGSAIYVVYKDGSDSYKLKVKKYSEDTGWVAVGAPSASGAEPLQILFNGTTPYMLSSNYQSLTVQKYNGTDWVPVGTDVTSNETNGATINFNAGIPYVIFSEGDETRREPKKIIVKKLNTDGLGWETVGDPVFVKEFDRSGGGGGMPGGGSKDPMYISFINTVPYVVYLDGGSEGKAWVKQFDGTDWQTLCDSGLSAGIAYLPSIASNGGLPYVAYIDGANDRKITVEKHNGTAWEVNRN